MTARLRVFNLGLPKSGTTTLGDALKHAGLRVADWKIRPGQSAARGFVGKLIYQGWFETGDPLHHLADFDAFAQVEVLRGGLNLWPQTDWAVIAAIRARHPGTRFVLTSRPAAAISDSMRRWSNLGDQRLPDAAVPGLPAGFGARPEERVRWIESHMNFCRHVFAGADDFLELDVAQPDARGRLSEFLKLDLPWWGVANSNARHPADAGVERT